MPVVTDNSEDALAAGKSNQEQLDAAEVKINAANAAIKTPGKAQHAVPDEYYEVKVAALYSFQQTVPAICFEP